MGLPGCIGSPVLGTVHVRLELISGGCQEAAQSAAQLPLVQAAARLLPRPPPQFCRERNFSAIRVGRQETA